MTTGFHFGYGAKRQSYGGAVVFGDKWLRQFKIKRVPFPREGSHAEGRVGGAQLFLLCISPLTPPHMIGVHFMTPLAL